VRVFLHRAILRSILYLLFERNEFKQTLEKFAKLSVDFNIIEKRKLSFDDYCKEFFPRNKKVKELFKSHANIAHMIVATKRYLNYEENEECKLSYEWVMFNVPTRQPDSTVKIIKIKEGKDKGKKCKCYDVNRFPLDFQFCCAVDKSNPENVRKLLLDLKRHKQAPGLFKAFFEFRKSASLKAPDYLDNGDFT